MKKAATIIAIACVTLAACSTPAQRMANCQAQGVSRDACYMSEQNRQTAMTGAAEKQALENLQHMNEKK
ncbi:hypothetical protein [Cupriavidus oxalaticus]|uniref:hypothetical protein n=1 Tax=Cupriavidus oxalaticus TaxID=96344 RepID=UPI00316D020E